ncbi:pimeloyl-ACP methyl ester carboxylesterase [Kribbella amoyensis]|uniref:Pimeloyl-ACP methyl ester carboxylesterase n=1 Tax=Kribbella amoyensis TaxID=996641 RepID=A0A561BJW7_9ACTN|nr:alpha/beta hydrolase [Kribbella amoyensis]TWD79157.1 pimeloyl-ACP methyl ester carboxylesterase [Kribbella amoyensis]
MEKTTSKDGTTIAYDRAGSGPAVVLVDGALCSRAQGPMPELAAELKSRFTVYNYDRRGRGDSGDTAEYSVEREIEDLAAVIEAAGGSAYVYGTSSGAALSLRAASAGVPIAKLAVFEAPFVVDASRRQIPPTWVADLRALVAEDRRGDAVKYFMTKGVGLPGIVVALMQLMPAWKPMKAVAHTLPYDAEVVGANGFGQPLDQAQFAGIEQPVLVVGGGKSPAWMRTSVRAVAAAVPGAVHREIPGQNHMIKATAIAPVLAEYFGGGAA